VADLRFGDQVLVDLNAVAARIHRDKDPEKLLVKEAVADLRQLITDQGMMFLQESGTLLK
jgi:E3 ubiquitin-protein ligase SHPRH